MTPSDQMECVLGPSRMTRLIGIASVDRACQGCLNPDSRLVICCVWSFHKENPRVILAVRS